MGQGGEVGMKEKGGEGVWEKGRRRKEMKVRERRWSRRREE